MIIKILYKSHFKVLKNFKLKKNNKKKQIFVKNIFIFLLFSKVFLKECSVTFFFKKRSLTNTSLLKAPSRHKKFFHQIFLEIFFLKVFFKFKKKKKIFLEKSNIFLKRLSFIFNSFGNNILNKVKFSIVFQTNLFDCSNILL